MAGERSSGAAVMSAKTEHMLTESKKRPAVGNEAKSHKWRKLAAGLSSLTLMDIEGLENNRIGY